MTAGLDLALRVADVRRITPAIRSIWLERADGGPLPKAAPGAHIRVGLPDGDHRCYSLVDFAPDARPLQRWRLGVRLDAEGGGGSRYMHALEPGAALRASAPRDEFPLEPGLRPILFLAGGIGVTPLISLAAHARLQGRGVAFHYAARSAGDHAFRAELKELLAAALFLHADDDPGSRLDLTSVLAAAPPEALVYACGPARMIAAVRESLARLGREEALRFELFAAPAAQAGDAAFEVVAARSGVSVTVAADQTIAAALAAAGLDPLLDCGRGECGVCQVRVLEGAPDHRDQVLTAAERASGEVMQICVSRAHGPRLVLDL